MRAWRWFTSDRAYRHPRRLITALDTLETQERDSLAERVARERDKHPGVTVRTVLARDRPARCLLENSTNAQLLVVGSRGQGGLSGLVPGSTNQALIHHATCPLLVVRLTAAHAP